MARRHHRDDYGGAISFGAFLILLAGFYIAMPTLASEGRAFIDDFKPVQISQNFWWLMPSENHPILYNAAQQFSYLFGLVQIIILGLRFARNDFVREKARTFSDVVFWVGAGYLFGMLSSGTLTWIPFLAALIILVGVSIIARSAVLLVASRSQPSAS